LISTLVKINKKLKQTREKKGEMDTDIRSHITRIMYNLSATNNFSSNNRNCKYFGRVCPSVKSYGKHH